MILRAFFLIALALASSQTVEDTAPFADVPNVTFTYYDVAGPTAESIRKDMNLKNFKDPADEKKVDSFGQWSFSWQLRQTPDGKCDADVSFKGQVKLPRLLDAPTHSKDVEARWNRYLSRLLVHEAGHVRWAWEQRGQLEEALEAGPCQSASAAAQSMLKLIREHDRTYDISTQHGLTQGAVFP